MLKCDECGHQIGSDANKCPNCGASTAAAARSIIIGCATVLLMVLGASVGAFGTGSFLHTVIGAFLGMVVGLGLGLWWDHQSS